MSRRSRKRAVFNPLSLAFLDVMSCGFGAVVLLFLILDHNSSDTPGPADPRAAAEIAMLEREIEEGEEGLAQIRNTIDDISLEVVSAQGLAERIQEEIDNFLQELAALENSTLARTEHVEQLQSDIEALEEELARLQAQAQQEMGEDVREFVGEGDRQYLTGLYLGGNRILILVDMSSSMLDETLVNIIRTRNMPDERKRLAPKWRRVVETVDWISSQLPVASRYQIYAFNDSHAAAIEGTEGQWLEVADRDQLDAAISGVEELVPDRGTDLQQVFEAIGGLSPGPDNIYLITDGLPTLGGGRASAGLVTPQRRLELFEQAVNSLPAQVPVNVILMPLEGDPAAAAAYWQLSVATRGSFMSPSKDWP